MLGDLESQVAGCLNGRDMVLDVASRYGVDALRQAVERYWARSEVATRAAIASIPDGTYRASSFLDDDGINRERSVPIDVEVRIAGDEITIDFSGVADQLQGPLNAGYEGGAVAAARIACKYVFSPNEPANDGAFRPIRVECPEGKFLNASATAPIGGSGFTIPTVVDTILRALGQAVPGRIPAAHHGTYGIHVVDGRLPEGGWFQNIESSAGGWGAAAASRRHRAVSLQLPRRHQGSAGGDAGGRIPLHLRMGTAARGFRRCRLASRRSGNREILSHAGAFAADNLDGTNQMSALGLERWTRWDGRTDRNSPAGR